MRECRNKLNSREIALVSKAISALKSSQCSASERQPKCEARGALERSMREGERHTRNAAGGARGARARNCCVTASICNVGEANRGNAKLSKYETRMHEANGVNIIMRNEASKK